MTRSDGWRPQRPTGRDSPRSEPGAASFRAAARHEFSGSVPVDETIPESTILAISEFQTDTPGLRDVSFRFHAGSAEAAAFIDLAPYGYPLSGPVYASFRVAVAGPKRVTVALDALDFGRLGVPGDIRVRATRLAQIDGLKIATLAFREGAVEFAGTLPTTYDASPPKPGAMP